MFLSEIVQYLVFSKMSIKYVRFLGIGIDDYLLSSGNKDKKKSQNSNQLIALFKKNNKIKKKIIS